MASSSGNWILPAGVAAVLGFGALWAVSQNRTRDAAAAEEAARAAEEAGAPRPFEDMPPEEPPEHYRDPAAPFGSGAGATAARAPEGLADDPRWVAALALAAEAEVHYAAAEAAKVAGDRARLNDEGNRARELFDRALEDTAGWEEELLAEYGETDPQVRAIVRARSRWFDRTRWLHKSIGR